MAWKFYLCQSSDMTRLGEFTKASSRQLQVVLNRAGSFSAAINYDDAVAGLINPITTCVEAVKDGKTVWSGPVMSMQYQSPARSIGIQCVGWFELLRRRLIRSRARGTTLTASDSFTGIGTATIDASAGFTDGGSYTGDTSTTSAVDFIYDGAASWSFGAGTTARF